MAAVSTLRMALAALAVLVCTGAAPATAQEFPTRLLRIIVPQSPGAAPDLVARVAGPELAKQLGQSVVVENRPGADYTIGYELVAKGQPADGYTLALVNVEVLALMPITAKDLRFEPLTDLVPAVGLVEGRYILASSAKMPWKSFNEMIATAKASPGKFNFGSPSHQGRLSILAITQNFGVDMLYIPYSAAATYFTAVSNAEVGMGFIAEATAAGMGDRVRLLATTGQTRMAAFRDAPTFAELGLPRLRGITFSLNVRNGTSKAIIDKLHGAAARMLQLPEVKAQYAKIGMEINNDTPDAAAARFRDTAQVYADIAKKAGISF